MGARMVHGRRHIEEAGRGVTMDAQVEQNLIDAGCRKEFVERYGAATSDAERLRQLRGYRRELLEGIHAGERRLECLDYLIYQLRTKG